MLLQALAERRIGRRDEASQWIWDIADMTREVHEEYAVQRWPETKRLLGLLVNSSGGAHARNARRLVHAARKQDRRLSAAILAAAVAHTPEAMEVVRGARTRMARKPSALSRELLRNFPKGRKGRNRRRRRKGDPQEAAVATEEEVLTTLETPEESEGEPGIDKPGVPDDDFAEGDYSSDEDRTDADFDDDAPRRQAEATVPQRSRRKPAAKPDAPPSCRHEQTGGGRRQARRRGRRDDREAQAPPAAQDDRAAGHPPPEAAGPPSRLAAEDRPRRAQPHSALMPSPRWTSPASSAVRPPSASSTTRRPSPSMPAAGLRRPTQ